MEKIDSFKINHLILKSGIYVSRMDKYNGVTVTTFDLRITAPNAEPPMDISAMHTLEHLGATYLRNSEIKDRVVYFGPMGCRTGFYLVLFGSLVSSDVYPTIIRLLDYIINFEGDIPGATAIECGNYLDQNLTNAKYYAKKYKNELKNKRFVYPTDTVKAGCVLLNKEKKEVCLVYREKYSDYSFPKGHLEGNESIVDCAIRETAEETKRKAKIVYSVAPIEEKYTTPSRESCICIIYLAVDNGESDNTSSDTHPIKWVAVDKVLDTLSYEANKETFIKLLPEIEKLLN